MARAVIVSALPCKQAIDYKAGDLLIACDMGYTHVKAAGLIPDIIIGDFDSLNYVPNEKNVIRLPVAKDDTDTGYAINYALEKGFSEILVFGAIGGLIDHTFSAFQLAAGASRRGANITFFGDNCYVTAVTNNKITLCACENRFSVFAVCKSKGVDIKGADFELKNAELSPFMPLGCSNRQRGKTEIGVSSGTLIVVKYL